MKTSKDRILVTHTGRLERPDELTRRMSAHPAGRPSEIEFGRILAAAVEDVVTKQVEAGVTVVTDGEFGKLSWNLYVISRLSGWELLEGAKYRDTGKDRAPSASRQPPTEANAATTAERRNRHQSQAPNRS